MGWRVRGWQWLRSIARGDRLDDGLDEEMRCHIDQQSDKNLRAGMSPAEARRQALVRFGGVEAIKDDTRDEIRPPSRRLGAPIRLKKTSAAVLTLSF